MGKELPAIPADGEVVVDKAADAEGHGTVEREEEGRSRPVEEELFDAVVAGDHQHQQREGQVETR